MNNTFAYRYPFPESDIPNALDEIQERLTKFAQGPEDDGVTYEWVLEQIDEKLDRDHTHRHLLEAKISQLEIEVKELKLKCEKL